MLIFCEDKATDEKNYCISSIIRELDEIFKVDQSHLWCSTKYKDSNGNKGTGCYLRVPGHKINLSTIKSDYSNISISGNPELTLEEFLASYIRDYGNREYKNFYANLKKDSHLVCFYENQKSK